ncbi:MAG: hypothetical protein ACRBM6_04490 [Geminicoccales bacterium]
MTWFDPLLLVAQLSLNTRSFNEPRSGRTGLSKEMPIAGPILATRNLYETLYYPPTLIGGNRPSVQPWGLVDGGEGRLIS